MDGLYDRDFLLWAEAEAEKLRRLRAGERVNDVDWENLIEEVESLGLSELKGVGSLLFRAMEHVLKVIAWPEARHVEHWLGEANTFLSDAADRCTPAMRQRLSAEVIHVRALRNVRTRRYEGMSSGPLPLVPWYTLDELLSEEADAGDLVARAPKD